MKRVLFATVGVLGMALAGTAGAADLPRRAEMPAKAPAYLAAPIYNWTGLYLGLNGGGGWGRSSWDSAFAPTGDFSTSGGVFGGTAGYNMQVGQAVFGIEGDIDGSNIRGTTTVNCFNGCQTRNTWLSTVRGRLGYAADRWMPYITGGVAFGDIKASVPGAPGASDSKAGWTAGGGVEFAIAGNWSAKAEYLYVNLGSFDCGANCGTPGPDNIKFNTNLIRGGVNYRF
jgi:outer membrane immunogenic protein